MQDTDLSITTASVTAVGNLAAWLNSGPSGADGQGFEVAVLGAVVGATPSLTAIVQVSNDPTFATGVRTAAEFKPLTGTGQRQFVRAQYSEDHVRIRWNAFVGTSFANVVAAFVSGAQRDQLS